MPQGVRALKSFVNCYFGRRRNGGREQTRRESYEWMNMGKEGDGKRMEK
jgi:hypothetical protein